MYLHTALANRRQIAYSRLFKKLRKELLYDLETKKKKKLSELQNDVIDEKAYKLIYQYHFSTQKYRRIEEQY